MRWTRAWWKVGVVLAGMVVLAAVPDAKGAEAPTSQETAPGAVEEAMEQALGILRNRELTSADKMEQIRRIAEAHVDFVALSRLALGPHNWRELSEGQRDEFVDLFRKHLLGIYEPAIDRYRDQDVVVVSDQQESRGDWTVQTQILGRKLDSGKRKLAGTVVYRLRQQQQQQQDDGGSWKVIDLSVEGVSVAMLFRTQFAVILSNGGIDRVLQLLREKTGSSTRPHAVEQSPAADAAKQ